jgi:hypothetical protein
LAKLNGVKAVSESITYSGVTYTKSDAGAVVGDIIRYDDDNSSYVTEGGYYEVTRIDSYDDPQITDDCGDEFDLYCDDFTVYKAVKSAVMPRPEYTEVKRKATVGERIKIVNADYTFGDYGNGTEMTVENLKHEGVGVFPYNDRPAPCLYILDTEYVVLEPIAGVAKTPVPLKVGDYAKVIDNSGASMSCDVGDIVKIISRHGADNDLLDFEKLDGTCSGMYDRRFVRATDEEVAEAQRKNVKVGYYVKITEFVCGHYVGTIGIVTEVKDPRGYANRVDINANGKTRAERNVVPATAEEIASVTNSPLKVGDYARVIGQPAHRQNGTIVKIVGENWRDSGKYDTEDINGREGDIHAAHELERVTPAEAEAQRKPTLKAGDTVKLTIADGERPEYGYGDCGVKDGDIGILKRINGNDVEVDFPNHSGWNGLLTEFTPASAEDVKAEETSKWTAIGRKVGEFKAGDIVSANRAVGERDRITGHVEDTESNDAMLGLRMANGDYRAVYVKGAELIAPVETLFSAR